jgi:phospholipid/cholesterol/gamma-HCH transport system ATP-binding protein
MTQALLTPEPPPTSARHVVELRDVVMRFGGKEVLDHVSLAVAPQERLVIIGQSGAGKTTILRLILGILKPNAGSIFFKQHEVSRLNDHQLEQVRMRMGMVYQDAALLSSLTVRENLALPLQELTDKTVPGNTQDLQPRNDEHLAICAAHAMAVAGNIAA